MILTENHSNLTNMVLMVSHNLREAMCNRSSLDWSLTSHESLCGFSGESFRHFMNNMGRIPDLNYLEVGSYCGSTLFSFLFNNLDNINKAYAVDNWSQFNDVGDPKSSFFKNRDLFFPNGIDQLEVIEHDCFTLDLSKIKEKINFYFYDGPHSEDDHYNAYMYYNDVLDDEFITVIDDWNSNSVKRGTSSAFKELGYEIVASFDIDTTDLDDWSAHPDVNWWRGAYIAVIKKSIISV
jgi:hypothetical protein